MRAKEFLHTLLTKSSCFIDKRILIALSACVQAVTEGAYLSISSIGRFLDGGAKTKHKIKRVDRLFANRTLQHKAHLFYQIIANWIVQQDKKLIVIIDASWFTRCGKYQFLSASIPVGSRSLPILEKVYLQSEIMHPKTHKRFLSELKKILPKRCKPIIVTDAGFQNPWFKNVSKIGWDYIGRAASSVLYQENTGNWVSVRALEKLAKRKAEFFMHTYVAKTKPIQHYIYCYKKKAKGRKKNNVYGTRSMAAPDNKKSIAAKKPWILLSSLSNQEIEAYQVINMYKKRMQIEEGFRDQKDDYHGLGLIYNRSINLNKINIALLVGAIARYALWALGLAVKKRGFHQGYQANTVKDRNVLSIFFIAKQFIRSHWIYHKIKDPWRIITKDEYPIRPEWI